MLRKAKRLFKDYSEAGSFSEFVPVQTAVSDTVFATKNGSLFAVLRVAGADAECLDAPEIDYLTTRFLNSQKALGEDYRIYQYGIKEPAPPLAARSLRKPCCTPSSRQPCGSFGPEGSLPGGRLLDRYARRVAKAWEQTRLAIFRRSASWETPPPVLRTILHRWPGRDIGSCVPGVIRESPALRHGTR